MTTKKIADMTADELVARMRTWPNEGLQTYKNARAALRRLTGIDNETAHAFASSGLSWAAFSKKAKIGKAPATKTTAKTPSKPVARKGERVTQRDAVAKLLADGKPQQAKVICAEAVKLIRPKPQGKTPEATVGAFLYLQAKRTDGLVVRTSKPGEFKLRPVKTSRKAAQS